MKALGLITTIFVFRRFSLHEYGTYQLVLSLGGILSLLMLVGIDEVFVAEGSRLRGKGDEIAALSLGKSYVLFRWVLGLGVFFISQIAEQAFGTWYSKDILHLIGIYGWIFLLIRPATGSSF